MKPLRPRCQQDGRSSLLKAAQHLGIGLGVILAAAATPTTVWAACTWSFNWYCSSAGCSRVMGRSTGNVDGFSSEQACERARSNWRNRGVDTMGSCTRSGICDMPAVAPSGPTPRVPSPGGSTVAPDDDTELQQQALERRRREEEAARQAAIEAARERQREEQFRKDKEDALGALKGATPGGALELKPPAATGPALQLKEAPASARAAALARKAGRLRAAPPIPPDKITFDYKIDDVGSRWLERLLSATDFLNDGVEILGMGSSMTIAGLEVTLPGALLLGGKVILAGQKGAEAYVLRKNAACDRALAYLKDERTRYAFSRIVRALREKRALPGTADPDMVQAAQAILDPRNAESHTAFDDVGFLLLRTPEARMAMLNKFGIEVGGKILGAYWTKASMAKVPLEREPFFTDQALFQMVKRAPGNKGGWVPAALPIDAQTVKEALHTIGEVKGVRDDAVKTALEVLKEGDGYLVSQYAMSNPAFRETVKQSMVRAEAVIATGYAASLANLYAAGAGAAATKGLEKVIEFSKGVARRE